ncbi:uncharacterized protein [Linepithema humile]|uniref:uncharacterized protein isoform X2 n=1 Tax=Linepithema humile TaxID=83485 RepID=UPI00351E3184
MHSSEKNGSVHRIPPKDKDLGRESRVCSQPNNFTVQITENKHVVYDIELLIRYNPYVGIFSYPETELVNVVFNESIIEFKGYILPEYAVTRSDLSLERLSWNASGIILGIGTLEKLSSENYAVRKCRLFLPTNIKSSANLPKSVENAIIYYAQSCVRERLCQRIGIIKTEELQNINKYNKYEYNLPYTFRPDNSRIDLSVNVPVDIALKKIIDYIKDNGKSIIKIPDVKETINIGLGVKCHFQTDNGTFQDLSTLKRTEDAIMSNIAQTYVIRFGFGLSTAKFNYNKYKLKVGFVTVSGKLLGSIERLSVAAKLVIDYDKTCDVNLKYIKVTEFGKIDLKMTGLGLLNTFTSNILTWLTTMWKNKIIKVIEYNVRDIVEEQLRKYICESNKNEREVIPLF